MKYWIFKCNPDYYDFDGRMTDPSPNTTWLATRYRNEIQPGDLAFVWQTGKQRAIRAVLKIESFAEYIYEIENEKRYSLKCDYFSQAWRVRATYGKRSLNIPYSTLREVSGLENLSVFHGMQQGTNFRVSDNEGVIISGIIETTECANKSTSLCRQHAPSK